MSTIASYAESGLGATRVSPCSTGSERFSLTRLLLRGRTKVNSQQPPLDARLLVDIGLSHADIAAFGLR